MKLELKYSRRIEGVSYKAGTHEVPESLRDHWYVKALVINGEAFIRSAPPVDECADADTGPSEDAGENQEQAIDQATDNSDATVVQEIVDGEIKEEIVDKKATSKKGKKKKDA